MQTREDVFMSIQDSWNKERWVWRFLMSANDFVLCESPGIDAPKAWVSALQAVARDLRCLRTGREVHVDGLVWLFVVNDEYAVTIGWQGSGGLHEFSSFHGLTMDASFDMAAAWVAETVQDDLAGFESVQWPSQGQYMLKPSIHGGLAVWVDPHTSSIVSTIGELHENFTCTNS